MPQTFQVLRCFKCLMFQVHQTKKSNKFICKMCGEKQSIKRYYGLGNALQCRMHVQKLNGIRGDIKEISDISQSESEEDIENSNECQSYLQNTKQLKASKWSVFIENEVNDKPNELDTETMYFDASEVVLDIPRKYKKLCYKGKNRRILNYVSKRPVKNTEMNMEFNSEIENSTNLNGKVLIPTETHDVFPMGDQEEIKLVHKSSINTKNFVLPKVNRCSKWAQYTEDSSEFTETHSSSKNNICNIDVPKSTEAKKISCSSLFSLCEEENLDSILEL